MPDLDDLRALAEGRYRSPADIPEPSTPPAQPPAERPAAAGPHPGTLDGPGVLGRALLDRDGNAWPANDREWAESEYGPVREVLLVDPARLQAAGRVVDAARAVAGLDSLGDFADWRHVAALHRRLRAAVDAYDRPTTGPTSNRTYQGSGESMPSSEGENQPDQSAPEPADDRRCQDCGRTNMVWYVDSEIWNRVMGGPLATDDPGGVLCPVCFAQLADEAGVARVWRLVPESVPEPAGDGPGWQRELIESLAQRVDRLGDSPWKGGGDHLRALLADRDRLATALDTRSGQLHEALSERDAARRTANSWKARAEFAESELAEVTAARDREFGVLTETAAAVAEALYPPAPEGTTQAMPISSVPRFVRQLADERDRLRTELATARRDAAADTLAQGARYVRQVFTEIDPEVARTLDALSRATRSRARPVPGSPEPGTDGGEERDHAE